LQAARRALAMSSSPTVSTPDSSLSCIMKIIVNKTKPNTHTHQGNAFFGMQQIKKKRNKP
jgi:hypothetical protein